jgi:hypothetical protein
MEVAMKCYLLPVLARLLERYIETILLICSS